jgi:hypothetical protein
MSYVSHSVIPAKAGIQFIGVLRGSLESLDPGLRRGDECV